MDTVTAFDAAGRTSVSVESSPGAEAFSLPESSAEVFTVNHLSQGTYNGYLIDTRYTNITGRDVLPCGDANSSNVEIKTHNPVTEKWVFWTAERLNAPPLLPALTTSDPNEIPITQEILFCNVLQKDYDQTVWKVSGVNKYKLLIAKNATSIYPIGTTPAEVAPAVTRYYGPEQFSTAIIDAGAGIPRVGPLNLGAVISTDN